MPIHRRTLTMSSLACLLGTPAMAQISKQVLPNPVVADEEWIDPARSRAVPVKIRWPVAEMSGASGGSPRPVILYSHGLGGTTDGGAVWGSAWVAAGFVVVHVQHPGSDLAAVRALTSSFTNQRALQSVAWPAQLVARLRDIGFVLDEIGRRHAQGHPQWSLARPTQVGMSGHSFGAHTTAGMAGQQYPAFEGIAEPRLAAFIPFSPTLPLVGNPVNLLSRLTRPVLSVTGTLDSDVVGVGATPEKRMAFYGALPKGPGSGIKAHLVLQDADHMTFAGQVGRAAEIVPRAQVTRDRQAAHHALVSRITTDWWLATLAQDTQALGRLRHPAGLASGDSWEIH